MAGEEHSSARWSQRHGEEHSARWSQRSPWGFGVTRDPQPSGADFKSRICDRGRTVHLGRFTTAHEARQAYDEAVRLLRKQRRLATNYPPGAYSYSSEGVVQAVSNHLARFDLSLEAPGVHEAVPALPAAWAATGDPALAGAAGHPMVFSEDELQMMGELLEAGSPAASDAAATAAAAAADPGSEVLLELSQGASFSTGSAAGSGALGSPELTPERSLGVMVASLPAAALLEPPAMPPPLACAPQGAGAGASSGCVGLLPVPPPALVCFGQVLSSGSDAVAFANRSLSAVGELLVALVGSSSTSCTADALRFLSQLTRLASADSVAPMQRSAYQLAAQAVVMLLEGEATGDGGGLPRACALAFLSHLLCALESLRQLFSACSTPGEAGAAWLAALGEQHAHGGPSGPDAAVFNLAHKMCQGCVPMLPPQQ